MVQLLFNGAEDQPLWGRRVRLKQAEALIVKAEGLESEAEFHHMEASACEHGARKLREKAELVKKALMPIEVEIEWLVQCLRGCPLSGAASEVLDMAEEGDYALPELVDLAMLNLLVVPLEFLPAVGRKEAA